MIASGAYSAQAEHLRTVYRTKRDLMLRALESEFHDFPAASWTVPDGGFYVWLTLDGIDTGPNGPLVPAALEAGVLYVPGEFGHVPDESGRLPNNECRLCYGVATEAEITEGIRRLRKACAAITAGGANAAPGKTLQSRPWRSRRSQARAFSRLSYCSLPKQAVTPAA